MHVPGQQRGRHLPIPNMAIEVTLTDPDVCCKLLQASARPVLTRPGICIILHIVPSHRRSLPLARTLSSCHSRIYWYRLPNPRSSSSPLLPSTPPNRCTLHSAAMFLPYAISKLCERRPPSGSCFTSIVCAPSHSPSVTSGLFLSHKRTSSLLDLFFIQSLV